MVRLRPGKRELVWMTNVSLHICFFTGDDIEDMADPNSKMRVPDSSDGNPESPDRDSKKVQKEIPKTSR